MKPRPATRRRSISLATAALLLVGGLCSRVQAETLNVPGDHKTIQAAIDAARPGDIVLVAPGKYPESIRLKERIVVKSAGDDSKGKRGLKRAEATVLDGGGAPGKGPLVVLADRAVLDGFTVTRVGAFDQKEFDQHYATQGENLPDERGAVGAGKTFPAVELHDVSATVKHCLVHDNGHAGIGCTGKHNASWIAQNIVFRNMGGGIGVATGARPTIEANQCFNNLRSGIGNRNSAGLIIKNECFDNVRGGIGIREGARPIVRNNQCYKNRRAGIGIRMEGTAPLIDDNDCHHNAMAGIGVRDGATPTIRGNRCHDNTLAGIGSRDGARPVIVENKCYRNKEAGIGSQLGAKPFIARNECYENEQAGIAQRSDAETTLDGNHVHHNKRAGIGFDECKAGTATVIHNQVIDNELVAVGIHGGWKVRLAGNRLSRAGGLPPLVMVAKGSQVEFTDNHFRGSGVAAIRTEGAVRVVNNRFECPSLRKGGGPPQSAIWGLPGADIVFVSNQVRGWRHALAAEKAAVQASFNVVSDYWQVGMQVKQSTEPLTAIGNRFRSELEHPGLIIVGAQGIVEDNRVEKK